MTVHQGYELNYPLMTVATTQHPGDSARREIILRKRKITWSSRAVREAADDDALIVRFYEWAGKKGDVHSIFRGRR